MDWVFQYDPDRIKMALVNGATGWWAATHHVGEMASGDRVYFVRSGPEAGITAVGTLTSEVRARKSEFGDHAVDVRITSVVTRL
jgi:hypothetical protein